MDNAFLDAIDATADTSFDASAPTTTAPADSTEAIVRTNSIGDPITCPVVLKLLAKPVFVERPSGGSETSGFLDGERKPGGVTPTKCPPYLGPPPSARTPSDDDKRGAWHLENEYLACRLGKNEQENGRLWNTVKWIEWHNRIATLPANAIQALNIYIDGSERMDRIDVDIPANGGFPDEDVNEGFNGYENGKVNQSDKDKLDLKIDDYRIGRLIDELKEIDQSAKFDINKLKDKPAPLPLAEFPGLNERVESGKIIRMLKLGMHTLWHPVIGAIDGRVSMASSRQVARRARRQKMVNGWPSTRHRRIAGRGVDPERNSRAAKACTGRQA